MDILVTPVVTILTGVGLSAWWAPVIGTAATAVGVRCSCAAEMRLLFPFLCTCLISLAMCHDTCLSHCSRFLGFVKTFLQARTTG